jgi:hypothetical protein
MILKGVKFKVQGLMGKAQDIRHMAQVVWGK